MHGGGVEGITTIGSAACCARSRFAIVDAEVIVQPTFHRYRGSVGHSGGGDADGDSAFRRCSSLGVVELPEEIHSIEEYAFAGNRSLSHLVIPSKYSGNILSPNAFYGCNQTSQVDMRITEKLIPYIGTGIHEECIRLTNVFRATHRDKTTALIRLETSMKRRHRQYITSHYQSMDVATLIITWEILWFFFERFFFSFFGR